MTISELLTIFKENPVIPCTNDLGIYTDEKYKKSDVILLYDFSIFDIRKFKLAAGESNKFTIFSLETMTGIANDDEGVRFLKDFLGIKAIESSSPRALSSARKTGMITIQTIFSFDSKSIAKAVKMMEEIKPDFIDIRPGISLLKFKTLFGSIEKRNIICSGLISSAEEIKLLIENGAVAITTSKNHLWNQYY